MVIGAVAVAIVGLVWSLASPIGASPDDDFHLATIWCDAGDPAFCRRTGQEIDKGFERVFVTPEIGPGMMCYHFLADVSAGCQAEAESQVGMVPSRANKGYYPGGFHELMSLFASAHVGRSVVSMRMVSWLLAVALLVAAAALGTPDLRRALALAALTTLVPMGVFVLASTNPSGLAVAGVAAYWCAAYAFMSSSLGSLRRRGALIVVLVGSSVVALGSRSDTGVYLAVASLAVWIATGGYRSMLRRRSFLLLAVSVVGIVVTLTGTQSQRTLDGRPGVDDRPLVVVVFDNARELPRLVLGSLGTSPLGWLDTPMPGAVSTLMLLALGGVLLVGASRASAQKWSALAVVAGAIVAIPMTTLVANRYYAGDPHYVQPRYLLPLLPVLVGTALVAPLGRRGVTLHRGQLALLVAAVALAHAAALHTNMRRYVSGLDVKTPDLRQGVEWWWGNVPNPLVMWFLGSVAFAVAAACIVMLVGTGSDGERDEDGARDAGRLAEMTEVAPRLDDESSIVATTRI